MENNDNNNVAITVTVSAIVLALTVMIIYFIFSGSKDKGSDPKTAADAAKKAGAKTGTGSTSDYSNLTPEQKTIATSAALSGMSTVVPRLAPVSWLYDLFNSTDNAPATDSGDGTNPAAVTTTTYANTDGTFTTVNNDPSTLFNQVITPNADNPLAPPYVLTLY